MEYKSIINISSMLRAVLEDGDAAKERRANTQKRLRDGEDAEIKRAIEKLEADAAKFDFNLNAPVK